MAQKKRKPSRALIALVVLVIALGGSLAYGVIRHYTKPQPSLALDLEGGTQLILTPRGKVDSGAAQTKVGPEEINQAINVIRQRVDASGVSEAEITSQGSQNIMVSLPGNPSERTLDLVRQSAEMNFRSVLMESAPFSQAVLDTQMQGNADEKTEKKTKPSVPDPVEYATQKADKNGDGNVSDQPETKPTNNSDLAWISEADYAKFYALDCTLPKNREGGDSGDPKKPLVTCSQDGSAKYILSPVDITGSHIKTAASAAETNKQGQTTGGWMVTLDFDSQGAKQFEEVTNRLFEFREAKTVDATTQQPTGRNPRNAFAIVLDGIVVSAPGIEQPIPGGNAQITGSFTKDQAATLANQLQFGSLPLNFEVQSEQKISATLGSDQLRFGVVAGIIGLILIVIYMAWQYRGLALVSVGSLAIAGGLAYLVISVLSWTMGYRLSLAGVAGIIISIGTTADSFIVYFERIRDEVRDGRPLQGAVDEGWDRAKRTIITSDAVNLLAAAVLYMLAVGGVQGFAFTLGVMTIIDLVVIFLFTHPLMQLLVRTKFFGGGHPLSGLDPNRLGASTNTYRYRGRGQVKKVASVHRNDPMKGARV